MTQRVRRAERKRRQRDATAARNAALAPLRAKIADHLGRVTNGFGCDLASLVLSRVPRVPPFEVDGAICTLDPASTPARLVVRVTLPPRLRAIDADVGFAEPATRAAGAAPTANPVGGMIEYPRDGAFWRRYPDGSETGPHAESVAGPGARAGAAGVFVADAPADER